MHGMSAPKRRRPTLPVDTWVCGPLHIEAQTFDGTGNNFGRLLRFKNTAGRWREWAMPMDLLRGDGTDLRGELLAMGLELTRTGAFTWRATCKNGSRKSGFAVRCKWAGAMPCSCCRMQRSGRMRRASSFNLANAGTRSTG
jgi:hypothetical protein